MQMAELHYTTLPSYDPAALAARAEELLESGIEALTPDSNSGTFLLTHNSLRVQLKDAAVSPQTAILSTDKETDPAAYAATIQQSWACNDAAARIESSKRSLLVTEMLARGLEPAERLRLFHGVLQAFVEITQPNAIVFMHSQQIAYPLAYLESCEKDPIDRLGALNVRFYSISNSETKDMLMDTRGLDEIGLHDLQVHFRDLDPNDVSQLLFNTAKYIFENGAVIDSGQTVAGTVPDSKWGCQFEQSLVEPQRDILDLNPGPPYAAGARGTTPM